MKQSVALLRYSDFLPSDVAFYHAGNLSRDHDQLEMAFVFFNRFIDICDILEDEADDVDESDFRFTDIPRINKKTLPKKSNFDAAERDDIRDWALTTGMDAKVSNVLPLRKCANCGIKTYLHALQCHSCKHQTS